MIQNDPEMVGCECEVGVTRTTWPPVRPLSWCFDLASATLLARLVPGGRISWQ